MTDTAAPLVVGGVINCKQNTSPDQTPANKPTTRFNGTLGLIGSKVGRHLVVIILVDGAGGAVGRGGGGGCGGHEGVSGQFQTKCPPPSGQ